MSNELRVGFSLVGQLLRLAHNRCLRQRFLLGPPSVGYGYKIVSQEDMSYVEHVLQDGILMGGHVLQKNLSHGRSFLVGGYILWEDMSYWRIYVL